MTTVSGLGVVIADDARLFRSALAELLTKAGCRILAEVGDPDALLAAVEASEPDLAVVDIRMPPRHHLEGLHAAVRIRTRNRRSECCCCRSTWRSRT